MNHIVCSSSIFLKFWGEGKDGQIWHPYYNLYEMREDLAVGYFISNLLEFVYRNTTGDYLGELPDGLKKFLYPLPEGKGVYCKKQINVLDTMGSK